MPTVLANGAELYYEITGTAPTPVVLVHGSWGDHHNWDRVVPALAERFTVLTYDRRGHSRSTRGERSAGTQEEDAMDLAALLETLDFAPAHVVGNSFGAAVTLRLACARPALLRSLTAHEPPLFGLLEGDPILQAPLAGFRERVSAVVELLQAGDLEAGARRFVETIAFGPGAWDAIPDSLRRTFVTNATTFLEEQHDPRGYTIDLARLRHYVGPALLSRGDQSAPFFPAVVAKIAAALPHATQHLFAGAGHVPHLEQPEAYIDVVSRFIASAVDNGRLPTTGAEPGTIRA